MKVIVMTGGGSSGHVTPNIALMPKLKEIGYEINYIGSRNGIEKRLIEKEGIPYYPISAGKLRRYFDLKNVADIFRVAEGLWQAVAVIKRLKPDVIFSKGGFVSCPVVWAASICRIPIVIHESDITPGLTNRLSMPFARKVCYTFPESKKHIPDDKGVLTGIPIRQSLMYGDRKEGKKICSFHDDKPIIMVIGGSQGAESINITVRSSLELLLKEFQICHICGKGNIDIESVGITGYKQFEYVNDEQPHLFAMADIVISRAGSTTIFEILSLRKPNLLIPLSKKSSRGDQILNARSFEKQGYSMVLEEEKLDGASLVNCIKTLYREEIKFIASMEKSNIDCDGSNIINIIEDAALKNSGCL